MNLENWLIFCSIALVATITPGPAILLTTTHSVAYGLKKSLATIFGNISGLLLMSSLSVLGLSTIILYSTTVFLVVKFVPWSAKLIFRAKLTSVLAGSHEITGNRSNPCHTEKLFNLARRNRGRAKISLDEQAVIINQKGLLG